MIIAQQIDYNIPEKAIKSIEVPELKNPINNEVLFEVLAFPINPADLLSLEGKYATKNSLPSKLGAECIGRVIKIGNKVKSIREGDLVIPLDRNNWVQKKISFESNLIKLPKNINILQGSMLKVNPATAYLMLNNYINLKKDNYIIQNASNSGVGRMIIGLAKFYGIKTINLVRREKLIPELKTLGADFVILDNELHTLDKLNISSKPILAIDAIGGNNTKFIADKMEKNSIIINYGLLSGKNIELTSDQIIFNGISLKGFWLTSWLLKMSNDEKNNLYHHLAELVTKKAIYTPIEKTYELTEIQTAVEHSNRYNRNGKILITPNGNIF